MDCLLTCDELTTVVFYDVAGSAKVLGVSMSQLSRLVNHHPAAFSMMNKGRESVGLPVLRK